MQVAQAVGEALARLGVRQVFGVIGSGNFAVTQALHQAGARFAAARHESGAVSMADGYARASGQVGVASVHQGPGLTNTLTSLTEAAKSRTPLLLLAGEAPAAARTSNFRIDQAALVTTAGALAERLTDPASAVADTARALGRAERERRPVALLLPLDVQAAACPQTDPPAAAPPLRPPRPAAEAVKEVAGLLDRASRPVLIAGRGAALAGARRAIERLGEQAGALLATSAVANGLFAGNPWALGIAGGFATPLAARLLADADLVVAFGASLNYWTTRHGRLIGPGATVVQVDLDEDAIGRHRPVDVGIIGDARETALALGAALARRDGGDGGYRTQVTVEQLARGWRDEPYDDAGGGHAIDPRTLSIALDELLPAERTVAVDSGHFMGWPAMYLRVPDPAGFVFTQAFQAVGLGLASAIGAAVARPDRLTVAALGDGGALMALGEFETAARLGLRLLIVVYNDAAYGAEVHHFGPMGHPVDLVRFPDPDFAALGRAAGAAAVTVRHRDDLAAVADWLRRPDRPMVVDAKVHPGVRGEWLAEAFRQG